MADARLGRKWPQGRREMLAGRSRACVVCGGMKPPAAFQPKRRGRALNLYCNDCAKQSANVRRALQPRRSPLADNARAIHKALTRLGASQIRRKGVKGMTPEELAVRLRKLPERIAAVVGKSYAVKGDSFELADDEIVGRIRDLLDELDETLIERNKNKKLARR